MIKLFHDLAEFMCERKKFCLTPTIVITVLLHDLIVLAESSAVVAFLYTAFREVTKSVPARVFLTAVMLTNV